MAKPKLRNYPDLSDLARPGAVFEVKVTPKAAADRIFVQDEVIRIHVTAQPENGRANNAVQQVLATALGVPALSLELRRGHTSRVKLFVYQP